jgi:hypothetical protein
MFVDGCPGPEWMVWLEEAFRASRAFLLLSGPLRESKTLNLFADGLRKREGR